MSTNDIKIRGTAGLAAVPTYVWQVDDRTTTSATTHIHQGEFAKQYATDSQYVVPLVDADLTVATDYLVVGLAKNESTETSTVNGEVELYMPLPGIIYEIATLLTASADTQAEIDALKGQGFVLDLASEKFTADIAAGSAATNGFKVVGGDYTRQVIYFVLVDSATFLGRVVV